MPSFIVKPMADEDWYVVWSTVVDAPTAYGGHKELAELLGPHEGSAERFERADEFGTSMNDPEIARDRQWFGWHDREFLLMEWPIPNRRSDGCYQVPRENVRALCERGEAADPTDLLTFTISVWPPDGTAEYGGTNITAMSAVARVTEDLGIVIESVQTEPRPRGGKLDSTKRVPR